VTRDLVAFVVGNVLVLGAGYGALRLAGVRPLVTDLSWSVALGYVAGASIVGVLGSAALVLGLELTWWQIAGGCLALLLAGLLRRGGQRPAPGEPWDGWSRAVLVGALVVLAILAADLAVQPVWTDDAWSIWSAKASSIVYLDGLNARYLASDSVFNADYPLVVPVLELVAYRFCGLPNELIPLQLGLLFLAFPFALLALLRSRVRPFLLALTVLAVSIAPTLQIQTASAVADVPLAVFFALAGVAAWLWIERGGDELLLLAGLFSAAAVGTKIEGALLVGILALAVSIWVIRRQRPRGLPALIGAAVVASAMPWEIWSRVNSLGGAVSDAGGVDIEALTEASRLPRAAEALARELIDPTSWLALVGLAALSILFALRRPTARDAALFTLLVVTSALVALLGVYWITPLDFDYHVETSVRRVITAPVVFAAAMAPLLLSTGSRAQPPR
jgi:hypothetical protein